MVKYLKKLALIAISALIICTLIVFATYFATKNVYADNYQKGYVYQYRRLQSADKNTPKVIVFGGSYLAFSLDTQKLQEYLDMPCYELGVQSNMGMCYSIELISENINEGDVVVFPFEDFARDDYGMDLICLSLDGQADMTWDFMKKHPKELISTIPRATFRRVTGILRTSVTNAETVYLASAFNQEYGFYQLDRPEPVISLDSVKEDGYAYTMKDVDPSCLEILNELNSLCEKKGAKLVITFAPMCTQSVFTKDEGRQEYVNSLDEALDADIICNLDDCFYDYEYVYNDNSHLNNAGQQLYTKDLANILKPYL